MEKTKCIIIDDEPIARQYLSDYVNKMPQLELIAAFDRATDAYELIETTDIGIVFLDIHMPGLTGIEFIRTLQRKPEIILTTAYSEYALQGYELEVTDYLLKPISFERFARAVEKAVRHLSSKNRSNGPIVSESTKTAIPVNEPILRDYMFVKSGYKSVKVNISEILYVEGMKEYVLIYTKEKKYIKLDRMKNVENVLKKHDFLRIHKSYIVSLKKIDAVFGNTVEINGAKLPVGRNFKDELNKILGTNG